ncbi:sodium- and chloride-dependent glycine transporter 1-like [Pollicipes pollicipes]|uniref:sodium- and chloride-dependent glycine transporter 1-like n=1 Tax=Pollicipes pollicipes TaxID=41117 RepID=UPI00188513F9|nr:sodium- and chloride-dependent glycine transporter 1-like [Pollicipes pollicipes]
MVIKETAPSLARQLLPDRSLELSCIRSEEQDANSCCSEDSGSSNSGSDEKIVRGNWTGKLDFFLSCVGYAVGLGNIWRFPYLCYRSGGGAFLIPYFTFLLLCGMPLFMMELAFGQFANQGPISVWRISPIFKGLGYGMVLISGIVCIYYNVIITWTLYYMYLTFRSVLPWSTCGNWWNTDNCVTRHINNTGNGTFNASLHPERTTASEEFWRGYVLQISDGIDDIGQVRTELIITLFVAWIIIFCCLFKGVESSGKVVYFSATFPYLVLLILMVRGVTLPGAMNGIKFYLSPKWELLKTFKVWGDAATQIFYSVGPAWGGILTMASYNRFRHNCYRDALIVPLINCGTSVFAGLVVFAIIGFMAQETGRDIEDVVSQGPGLAFIVYPEAVARLPISPLWAFLFFSMLFTIGIDSQFGMFECLISAFVDEFPVLRPKKILFTAGMCFVLFLLGIPCVTNGGVYVLQLMDWYSAAFSLMIVSLLECIVIAWVYGEERFSLDIEMMVGRKPNIWFRLCWKYISPAVICFILLFTFINHEPVTYNDTGYPDWAIVIGWLMALVSIAAIPAVGLMVLLGKKGTFVERLMQCVRPDPMWGPIKQENRLLYRKSLEGVRARFPQTHVAGVDRVPSGDSLSAANEIACLNTTV